MANLTYKLALYSILVLIVAGGIAAYAGYSSQVYPLDLSRGLLDAISTSSDPQDIQDHILAIKGHLPRDGNPVWIFPTETTSYERMHRDLDTMLSGVQTLATLPTDSSAYNTGMLDMKVRSQELSDHILDAIPYAYVSISNIIISMLWVVLIIVIFAALKHKKDELTESDKIPPTGV